MIFKFHFFMSLPKSHSRSERPFRKSFYLKDGITQCTSFNTIRSIQYQHRNIILTELLMKVYLSLQRVATMISCMYHDIQKTAVNIEILLLHRIYLFNHRLKITVEDGSVGPYSSAALSLWT